MKEAVEGQPMSRPEDCLAEELQYRRPMRVREIMVFPAIRGTPGLAVCPRCRTTMEREYMAYCDRCGQCLDWHGYKQAAVIYPGTGRACKE